MDLRERIDAPDEALVAAIRGVLTQYWTSLPVIVQSSDGHTATLQAAIKGKFVNPATGKVTTGKMAPFQDVPVHFPNGGGVSYTHPVAQGDEGILHFLARPQDTWWQNGGSDNEPIDDRTHSLSDARYHAGGRSNPRKLSPAPSQVSLQSRSDDGNHVYDVHPKNGLTAASSVKHTTIVGGQNGSGTLHIPDKIIKNAKKILLNTIQAQGIPPPGQLTVAQRRLVATLPLPALSDAIASAMSGVLSGGGSSLFKDPTAAANSALSQTASNSAGMVTSALGGAGATLVAALTGSGGLGPSLATLATATSGMSGASAPSDGNPGLAEVRNHLTKAQTYFGDQPPATVSPTIVTAPLTCSAQLKTYGDEIDQIVAKCIAGLMSVSDATAAVEAITAEINALVPASAAAIDALAAAEEELNNALEAANSDPATDGLHSLLASASPALAELRSAMNAILELTPSEVASAAAFPVDGARGGT